MAASHCAGQVASGNNLVGLAKAAVAVCPSADNVSMSFPFSSMSDGTIRMSGESLSVPAAGCATGAGGPIEYGTGVGGGACGNVSGGFGAGFGLAGSSGSGGCESSFGGGAFEVVIRFALASCGLR